MMQLLEVNVERFKAAFQPGAVPLGPFNVIIGRNGSGKSTLLEALQWVDTTIRRDAREASDRYQGSGDLVNLRSRTEIPYFGFELTWGRDGHPEWRYKVTVNDDGGVPSVVYEELSRASETGRPEETFLSTQSGVRWVFPAGADPTGKFPVHEHDRLALPRVAEATTREGEEGPRFLTELWRRAVFLRLSPNRLAAGSPATRKSYEPLLDEEGQTLPALLHELTREQRGELVAAVQEMLPGIRDVEVSESQMGRDARVHYSLLERMPYRGRSGRKQFPIPAWMLSEGTRRITAILALLVREPRPSLLCIEEVENGLDPWTIKLLLRHLLSAADDGIQILVTTHSPWLLDDVPMDSIIQVRRREGDTRYERFADRPEIQAYAPHIPAGTRYVNEAE